MTIRKSWHVLAAAVLLASVKHWQFHPAMRGGRAVKYRRLSGVVSQR